MQRACRHKSESFAERGAVANGTDDDDELSHDGASEVESSSSEIRTPSLVALPALPPPLPLTIADFDLGGGASLGSAGGGGQAKFKI